MNLKAKAVNRISESIIPDVVTSLKKVKEDYLDSKEFKALLDKELSHVEDLENIVNAMGDLASDHGVVLGSAIILDGYTFKYSTENECFEFQLNDYDNIAEVLKIRIQQEMGIHYMYNKEKYISRQVYAIVSTVTEDATLDDIKKVVTSSINLKELLFNKNI